MEKEKRKEKMVEKKAKTCRREGEGRQTVFRGHFVLQKLSTHLQCAFLSPSLFTGSCTERSRETITQELLKIHLDTEQRCPKRKETA